MSWTWWMTVLVILAVLVLIDCIPVGVDAAYGEGGVLLSAKLGFLKLQLLPKKPKKEKPAGPLPLGRNCGTLGRKRGENIYGDP